MNPLHPPILPGATIGVLGSGQLGRMFALAARELGYRIFIYSPDNDTPAGQIGDQEFACAYTDLDQIREFARQVQVVTFEFENVHADSTSAAAEFAPVRPDGRHRGVVAGLRVAAAGLQGQIDRVEVQVERQRRGDFMHTRREFGGDAVAVELGDV